MVTAQAATKQVLQRSCWTAVPIGKGTIPENGVILSPHRVLMDEANPPGTTWATLVPWLTTVDVTVIDLLTTDTGYFKERLMVDVVGIGLCCCCYQVEPITPSVGCMAKSALL